jgi:uncharacterized phiE125 gp8 family phage protein
MKTIVLVAPTAEPVTLDEAKEQLRIEPSFTEDDGYITSLISVARDRCESYCNQFFTVQDIKILIDGFIIGSVILPYQRLDIASVKYKDADGVEQILPTSDYRYDADTKKLTFLTVVSASISNQGFSVYAATAAPVQIVGVQQAIKIILTDLYELRTETAVGVSLAENPAVKAMLYPYRESLSI